MPEPRPLPSERPPLHVVDVPERRRYEGRIGSAGALAALLDYERSETRMVLLRTEVQEGFEGQGIGSQLVHRVLDDIRARDLTVVPKCPFVVGWLERHPEHQDLLVHPLHESGPAPSPEPPEPA